MKIISWNINGLRAICKKIFLEWFQRVNVDIVCMQEIKIQEEQLPEEIINLKGYNSYFNFALKRGYSGVAVFC